MSQFVLGVVTGVVVSLFCGYCYDAATRAEAAESEIEAWADWIERNRKGGEGE